MAIIRAKKLTLKVGETEYHADISSCMLEPQDGPATFGNPNATFYSLVTTAYQNVSATSWHTFIAANSGKEFEFTMAPHGNEVPTAEKPHYTGTIEIGQAPTIGGEVNTYPTFDSTHEVVEGPNRVEEVPDP